MSTPSIVRGTKMNVGAILVFCGAILVQGSNAAPATFEVAASTDNPLIQNAAAGDVMLKTPEPLNPTGASVNLGSAADTLATALNDSMDQVQGDHILGSSTPTANVPNGNTSASFPTYSPSAFATTSGSPGAFATASGSPGAIATASGMPGAFATASGSPGASTFATTTSPLDSELATTSGPATTTGLAVADPMMFYRILTNLLRQPEQFMQSLYPPFSGMTSTGFPSLRMPNFRQQIPNIGLGANDPSLKLVDQKIIDEGNVKGQFNTYEGQPDPNTVTKMQTGQFSVNQDGLKGAGVGHYYTSSSASSSGGNPIASVGTFFGGLPTRFNMGFPLRLN